MNIKDFWQCQDEDIEEEKRKFKYFIELQDERRYWQEWAIDRCNFIQDEDLMMERFQNIMDYAEFLFDNYFIKGYETKDIRILMEYEMKQYANWNLKDTKAGIIKTDLLETHPLMEQIREQEEWCHLLLKSLLELKKNFCPNWDEEGSD